MKYVFDIPGTDLRTGDRTFTILADATDKAGAKACFESYLGWPVPEPRAAITGEKIDIDLTS